MSVLGSDIKLFLLFLLERRKKQTFSKKSNSKLSPNYFIAIQITSLDVSDIKSFITVYFCP